MKKTFLTITSALVLASLLVACPPTPDVTPPKVNLSSSSNNVITAGSIKLTATASDEVGISRVEFYEGATKLGEDITAPYEQTIDFNLTNNGTKTYTAKAFDAANNSASSDPATTVTVNIPDTTPPTIKLSSDASNVVTASTIKLTAVATDNVGVTKVVFFEGTTKIGEDTTAPFEQKVDFLITNNGSKTFTAKAFDAADNATSSDPVGVVVNIPLGPDTLPPSVSLSSSLTKVTAAGSIKLTATAIDNVGVAKVEFFDGTTKLGEDSSAPYELALDFAITNNGAKTYTAKAYDAANNSASSNEVAVAVNILDITAPTVNLSSTSNNVVLPGSIKLTATATDDIGVSKVEFYDGTTKLGEDSSVPFEQNVDLARANNGAKLYSAKAFDAANNSASSAAVAVTVNIPEILPPTGTPAAKGDVVDAVSSLVGRSQGVQTSVTTQTTDYYKELNLSSLHVPGQAPVTVLQVFGQMADSAVTLAQNGFDSRALADKITNMASKVASSTRANTLSKLPTGDYDCTTTAATCPNNNSTSSDLKVTWKTLSNKTAIAIIDWDGSSIGTASAPAEITNYEYSGGVSKVQVPTKTVANVTVEGKVVLKAQFESQWESSSWTNTLGGYTQWSPSINNMSFIGTLFSLDGITKLIDIPKLTYSHDTAGLKTSGDISIALNDPYHVKWDINLGGTTIARTTDYPNAVGTGLLLTPFIPYNKVFTPKGALSIALSLEIGTKLYAFETKATDWTYSANGGIVSLDGITGSFAADNKLVTFAGKLDGVDANKNCLPFENLNLTFSDGTVTLEQFLIDRFPSIIKPGNCP